MLLLFNHIVKCEGFCIARLCAYCTAHVLPICILPYLSCNSEVDEVHFDTCLWQVMGVGQPAGHVQLEGFVIVHIDVTQTQQGACTCNWTTAALRVVCNSVGLQPPHSQHASKGDPMTALLWPTAELAVDHISLVCLHHTKA